MIGVEEKDYLEALRTKHERAYEIDNQAEKIEYLERSNNRREDIIAGLEQEIDDLDNDWINLNKYIDSYIGIMINNPDAIEQGQIDILYEIKDKMKEIKGGNK